MESGFPLSAGGLLVLCVQWTKFRAATSQTYQSLFILQRPLVRAVPCHGSAPSLPGDLMKSFQLWKWEGTDSDISLCAHWLKHWIDFSVCMGVHKGNSGYRMRPGYSKFLHFIACSPQQDTRCEAGLRRFEVESTLPSGTAVNQTTGIYAPCAGWNCFFLWEDVTLQLFIVSFLFSNSFFK